VNDPIDSTDKTDPRGKGRKRPPIEGRHTLSHQLRAVVRGWGLSAYEVARRADIDVKVLSRFLAGDRGLTMATADRIAAAFGLKLGEALASRRPAKPAARRKARPAEGDDRWGYARIADRTKDAGGSVARLVADD
jgi:hypothetical protein